MSEETAPGTDDEVRGVPRLSVVLALDHPAQHFSDAFRALAQSQAVRSTVFYWDTDEEGRYDPGFGQHVSWDVDLLTGYDRWTPARGGAWSRPWSLVCAYRARRPDVVICYGWGKPIAWITILTCLATRIPLVLYGDSTWQHSATPVLARIRAVVLRTLFRGAAGALSTGTFNREFYVRLGMPSSRVVQGVCPIAVAPYEAAFRDTDAIGSNGRRPTIGFAGKLKHQKGVDELLRALALVTDLPWTAKIIGDGPDRPMLEALAAELDLTERVSFLGFQNTSAMPMLLSACDIVVVPSRWDLRVLVVPEAMAAGACVVVSSATAVWGPEDLVEDGESGLVYQSGNPSDLASCLRSLLLDPEARAAMRREGARRAAAQGPTTFVAGVERAAAVLGRRAAR